MKVRRSLTLLLCAILALPVAGWAAKMPEPKVDYSADTVMEMESHTMKGKVYYSQGKRREEMGGGEGMTTIIRQDKQVMWTLMGDMYMEMPLGQSEDNDWRDMDIQQTEIGEEVVNGVKAMKSKVIATKADGKKFGGFFWMTTDNITVKMDLLMKDGDKKDRILMELTNLKIGKQDPKLFEPPPGATRNDMGAMMGMGRGKKGKGNPPEQGAMPDMGEIMKGMKGQGADGGEGIDINKMMKDMMGR